MAKMIFILISAFVVPLIVLTASGVRKALYIGPLPEAYLRDSINHRIRIEHGLNATLAMFLGFYLISWGLSLVGILAVLLLGWPIGIAWGRYRMRRLEVTRAGPDESVPDEKLFPSDRFARMLSEGHVPPLPLSVDVIVVLLCEGIGVVVGLLLPFIT